MVVKDDVGHSVLSRHGVGPELSHEEDLIGVFGWVFALLGLFDPFLNR